MGGAIMLRAAHAGIDVFERFVLCAPMIDLPGLRASLPMRGVMRLLQAAGMGERFIPGGNVDLIKSSGFPGNPLTSDPRRYVRNVAILEADPTLGIASPTVAWLAAAFAAMAELRSSEFAERIRQPVLMLAAGDDTVVSTPASAASTAAAMSSTASPPTAGTAPTVAAPVQQPGRRSSSRHGRRPARARAPGCSARRAAATAASRRPTRASPSTTTSATAGPVRSSARTSASSAASGSCSGRAAPTSADHGVARAPRHGLAAAAARGTERDVMAVASAETTSTAADVTAWRYDTLRRAGYAPAAATRLARAGAVDLHRAVELLERGCEPRLALRILL
jgi:hypothetical protein